ncbi:MAG: hypothetical protein U9Q67_00215 [Patescibacteria group bacterium]|nr:hypothetical protein [Patescibacteria group bacterium]
MFKNTSRSATRKILLVSLSLLLSAIYIAIPKQALAAINRWDTDFNTSGFIKYDEASIASLGLSMLAQSDGKIVVAGSTASDGNASRTTLWRYNPDGTLDTTFGAQGIATHIIPGNIVFCGAFDLHEQVVEGESKYIAVGYCYDDEDIDQTVIWRFNSDGALDTTFNDTGYVLDFGAPGADGAIAIRSIVQDDGKIVAVGYSVYGTGLDATIDTTIWRFLSNGEPDPDFGVVGVAAFPHPSNVDSLATDVKIQQRFGHTRYIIASYGDEFFPLEGTPGMGLTRVNYDGTLDTTFGTNGFANIAAEPFDTFLGGIPRIEIQADGNIVVACSGANGDNFDLGIWRYLPDGAIDTSFAEQGIFTHRIAANNDCFASDIVLHDNKIAVSGFCIVGNDYSALTIWRLNNNGTLDTTFNTTGYHTFPSDTSTYHIGLDMDLLGNNRYLIAGIDFADGAEEDDSQWSMAVWSYYFAYQISNLQSYLATTNSSGQDVSVGANHGAVGQESILLKDSAGNLIAEMQVNFAHDLDWSLVSGGYDTNEKKSFANFGSAEGTSPTFSLYVPKGQEHNRVGICPGAISLAGVTTSCENIIYKTANDSDVSIVTINGIEYFKVDGLTGTGGFASTTPILPVTGLPVWQLWSIGMIILSLCLRRTYQKHQYE